MIKNSLFLLAVLGFILEKIAVSERISPIYCIERDRLRILQPLGVVGHGFKRQVDVYEFEANLIKKVNFRPVRQSWGLWGGYHQAKFEGPPKPLDIDCV